MSALDQLSILLVAAFAVTLPVFAFAARGWTDEDVARRPASKLIGRWLRNWLMWLIRPVEAAAVRGGVSPILFNYAGVGLGLAAGASYAWGEPGLAAWFLLMSGIADILDGRVARALNAVSRAGAFLDSTLDRLAEIATFVGLAIYFADRPWAAVATCAALGASLLVSYARARAQSLGIDSPGGLFQRAERVVLLAAASFLDVLVSRPAGIRPGTILGGVVLLIAAGSLATALARTVSVARILRSEDAPPAVPSLPTPGGRPARVASLAAHDRRPASSPGRTAREKEV